MNVLLKDAEHSGLDAFLQTELNDLVFPENDATPNHFGMNFVQTECPESKQSLKDIRMVVTADFLPMVVFKSPTIQQKARLVDHAFHVCIHFPVELQMRSYEVEWSVVQEKTKILHFIEPLPSSIQVNSENCADVRIKTNNIEWQTNRGRPFKITFGARLKRKGVLLTEIFFTLPEFICVITHSSSFCPAYSSLLYSCIQRNIKWKQDTIDLNLAIVKNVENHIRCSYPDVMNHCPMNFEKFFLMNLNDFMTREIPTSNYLKIFCQRIAGFIHTAHLNKHIRNLYERKAIFSLLTLEDCAVMLLGRDNGDFIVHLGISNDYDKVPSPVLLTWKEEDKLKQRVCEHELASWVAKRDNLNNWGTPSKKHAIKWKTKEAVIKKCCAWISQRCQKRKRED